jgi:hypothetical protein
MSDPPDSKGPKTRDYLAELFVAGIMGDAKWQIYFPKRDEGFDFIAIKRTTIGTLIRPVQVKGLYPTAQKKDRVVYRWMGKLSQTHPAMIVAFCYFSSDHETVAPTCVAYVPFGNLKTPSRGGFRFDGASLQAGRVRPRRDFRQYFDWDGLRALDQEGGVA